MVYSGLDITVSCLSMETKSNQLNDNSIGDKETPIRNHDARSVKLKREMPTRNAKPERGFSRRELAARVDRIKPSEEKLV